MSGRKSYLPATIIGQMADIYIIVCLLAYLHLSLGPAASLCVCQSSGEEAERGLMGNYNCSKAAEVTNSLTLDFLQVPVCKTENASRMVEERIREIQERGVMQAERAGLSTSKSNQIKSICKRRS